MGRNKSQTADDVNETADELTELAADIEGMTEEPSNLATLPAGTVTIPAMYADAELVKMRKGDEVLHVHPGTVKAHEAAGWKRG